MNKDRIIGVGKQMVGSVKQGVGKLVGDAKLQADGKAMQVAGKLRNVVAAGAANLGVSL